MKKLLLRLLYALVLRFGEKEYDDFAGVYYVHYYLRPFHATYMDDGDRGTSYLDIMCPWCMRHVLKGWRVKEVVTDQAALYS